MKAKDVIILGIESSCDDTSAAILKNGEMLSNIVAGQKVHESYGGVVPELASRAHQQNIIPVVHEAIQKAGITKEDISAVGFTRGPGLLGSLLVGVSFAKSFAMALDIPLVEVNHMQGHVLAHFIEEESQEKPNFPFICLTVSGGHTQIVLVKDYFDMEVIGQTKDDAAGEAFDKAAKLMSIPYPGGPLVDKYAQSGDPLKYEFPISNIGEFDFSFSGLKTSLLYFLKRNLETDSAFIENNLNDICASYQHTIIKTLFKKLIKACKQYNIKEVAIAGGVSANSLLRSELKRIGHNQGWNTYIPKFEFCTDNAGMISIAAYYKYLSGEFVGQDVIPDARLKI
ncbi:MAG: tRNA (adenosine(37)-N6)-threonylcarbamoyltransferase complex transferase subunit TsaD [Crocinitomicaceae bacterium]